MGTEKNNDQTCRETTFNVKVNDNILEITSTDSHQNDNKPRIGFFLFNEQEATELASYQADKYKDGNTKDKYSGLPVYFK
jgi:hypothetical protein